MSNQVVECFDQSYLVGFRGTVSFVYFCNRPNSAVDVQFLPCLNPSVLGNTCALSSPYIVDTTARTYSRAEARFIWRQLVQIGYMKAEA